MLSQQLYMGFILHTASINWQWLSTVLYLGTFWLGGKENPNGLAMYSMNKRGEKKVQQF